MTRRRDGRRGPELEQCPNCDAVGLPERINHHDCSEILQKHQ